MHREERYGVWGGAETGRQARCALRAVEEGCRPWQLRRGQLGADCSLQKALQSESEAAGVGVRVWCGMLRSTRQCGGCCVRGEVRGGKVAVCIRTEAQCCRRDEVQKRSAVWRTANGMWTRTRRPSEWAGTASP